MRKAVSGEAEALHTAFAASEVPAGPEETARAVRALAPQLGAASCRLADRRRERRSVRLQAMGLAGCSILFLVLVYIGCQYKELLTANPVRWGVAVCIGLMAILSVVCLPILIKKKDNQQ